MEAFYDVVIYFILFSFAGWVCETIFCSTLEKKFVYRGFLNGPICPIYGFGGLMVVYILAPVSDNLILLFITGTIATTALEYFTSYIMEKLFNTKWWDYSHLPFNINGRVCLYFSLLFGGLSVVAEKLIYPPFSSFVENIIPYIAKPFIAWIMIAVFSVDLVVTVMSILQTNGKLALLEKNLEELRLKLEEKQMERVPLSKQWEAFKASYESEEKKGLKEALEELGHKIEEYFPKGNFQKFQFRRLNQAFPHRSSVKHKENMERLKQWLADKTNKKTSKKDDNELENN